MSIFSFFSDSGYQSCKNCHSSLKKVVDADTFDSSYICVHAHSRSDFLFVPAWAALSKEQKDEFEKRAKAEAKKEFLDRGLTKKEIQKAIRSLENK